jgi:hypothetical protein
MIMIKITVKSVLASVFLLCAFANQAQAQWVRQQVVLKPGWNAVFLRVAPSSEDCDAAFAGLPIESVWDWHRTADSAQFVQDPGTLIPRRARVADLVSNQSSLGGPDESF